MRTHEFLFDFNKETLSYELHIPFLMKAGELTDIETLIPKDKNNVLIRSVIGNYFERESTKMHDVKNVQLDEDTVLYSSSDRTFNYERVAKYAVNVGR